MIHTSETRKGLRTKFYCPNCGAEDFFYMTTPDYCYTCGKEYRFDLFDLMTYEEERWYFHFNGESSVFSTIE